MANRTSSLMGACAAGTYALPTYTDPFCRSIRPLRWPPRWQLRSRCYALYTTSEVVFWILGVYAELCIASSASGAVVC